MSPRRSAVPFVFAAIAFAVVPGASLAAVDSKITGTASDRERVALTRGAVFEATLEDVLGTLPATFRGLLPCADCRGIRVHLNLLPGGAYMQRMDHLREGHDAAYYELGASTLSADGRTLTLDGGREGKAYWLVKDTRTLHELDRSGNPIDSEPPHELTRRAGVEALEPRVTLSGMFRSQSGTPSFRDCRSNLEWPVPRSDDFRALERAYGERRPAPGSALMVSLEGRIEERPRVEGEGTEPMMIVEKFLRAMPGESCPDRDPPTGLAHTRWRPILVGDRDVVLSGQQREPWIVLDPRGMRVTGSAGCNRLSGSYEASGTTLRFGPLITTRMFCATGMDLETAFLRALEETRRFRASGRILELLDERGRLLARLEERNLD